MGKSKTSGFNVALHNSLTFTSTTSWTRSIVVEVTTEGRAYSRCVSVLDKGSLVVAKGSLEAVDDGENCLCRS